MKKLFIPLTILSVVMQAVYADGINLNKYYVAKCEDYSGTWEGVVTDPTDLFANGGPWPVTVVLSVKGNEIMGQSSAFSYAGKQGKFDSRMIRARCSNGQLSDIFWGKLDACGSLSQTGTLVSKNMLVMQLNYENAMINADMLAFLQRKSDQYYIPKSENMRPYDPKRVESCH